MILFVEDEFDVLDPVLRRLRRKLVESQTASFEEAGEVLSKQPFLSIVFDQYLGGPNQLGTVLYTQLHDGRFGEMNRATSCAFFTALSRDAVLNDLPEGVDRDVPVFSKSDGLLPLYSFLGVEETHLDHSPCRARTIVEVVGVELGKSVNFLVPGWESDEPVRIGQHRLPAFLIRDVKERIAHGFDPAGATYTAEANLDALTAAELSLDSFDLLRDA